MTTDIYDALREHGDTVVLLDGRPVGDANATVIDVDAPRTVAVEATATAGARDGGGGGAPFYVALSWSFEGAGAPSARGRRIPPGLVWEEAWVGTECRL